MKLIDYVLENDKDIDDKQYFTDHYNIPLRNYILENYCPHYFELFRYTIYNKPLKPRKEDKTDCKYNNSNYEEDAMCKKCWNREIILA